MKLVSFEGGFGRVEDDRVVPMGADLVAYLGGARSQDGPPRALPSVRLLAPVLWPEKIICVGLNYRDHAAESGQPVPQEPILFGKYRNSIVGPGSAIRLPKLAATEVDYEAELAVVIGRAATRVSPAEALQHVAGYTCANDVSARDLQRRGGQWLHGKAVDTFLPLGPWIVTADEIPDPQALRIRCLINGEVMQDSNTREMVFGAAALVSFISQTISLSPGDVISTGTPPGVGAARKPPRYLKAGDQVTVSIEGIGDLTNTVEDESAGPAT
jgi:2-keto-4-pentenoate hydratase/2-oxohepta-3-ene-1,7-dioic acid hydratase in catechol pathway